MAQVLVVEDDESIRIALVRGLTQRGHAVSSTATGLDAIAEISRSRPDVLVLDLGLPDLDGTQVLEISVALKAAPVIIASARDDDRAMVAMLNAGADDYVVKPYSLDQIDARIRAVLRRTGSGVTEDPILRVGGIALDPTTRLATLDDEPLDLTRKEFDLLQALIRHPGEVITKQALLAEVWQQPWGGGDRTVDVHLSWLRRKLGETAADPRYLISVRGVGVKLVAP